MIHSLGGHKGQSIWPFSQPWLITTKGQKAKVGKGPLKVDCQPQQWVLTTHMKCCLPGRLMRDSASKVFMGGWWHAPLLYLVPTKVLGLQKRAGIQHKPHSLHKQFWHSESFSSGNGGKPPQIYAHWWRVSLASRSKASSLRAVVLTFSCTESGQVALSRPSKRDESQRTLSREWMTWHLARTLNDHWSFCLEKRL